MNYDVNENIRSNTDLYAQQGINCNHGKRGTVDHHHRPRSNAKAYQPDINHANKNIRSDTDYYAQQGVNCNDGKRRTAGHHHGYSRRNDEVYRRDSNDEIDGNFYANSVANNNIPTNSRNYNQNDYDGLFRACSVCGEFNHKNANRCRRKGCSRNKQY